MIHPDHNRILQNVKTIHLIAVCGTAMGALACMLKDQGFAITGSDTKVYPPMSRFLAEKGIAVKSGFDASHLSYRPDLVVVGNAVSRDNVEVQATGKMGLAYCSMPQAVNRFAAAGKRQLLVAGTHGKTTTSSLLAWILFCAKRDPSFIIGGIVSNFSSNYRTGNGDCIVLEADEYDTAFFDKGPKFLHYCPDATVLTSVEFDHADIYRDLDHVRSAFGKFVSAIEPRSLLVHVDDDPMLPISSDRQGAPAGPTVCCRIPTGGWKTFLSIHLPPGSGLFGMVGIFGAFRTRMIGRHNLNNILAAIAVADHMDVPSDAIAEALERFAGVKRRQEIRGEKHGIVVIDDFAHHPTAVRETLIAVREHFSKNRLIAVFEPRTHSSMRKVFQREYVSVFDPGGSHLHPQAVAAWKSSRGRATFQPATGRRSDQKGESCRPFRGYRKYHRRPGGYIDPWRCDPDHVQRRIRQYP